MAKPLTVNRYLKNRAMDHIDHALGRPLDPTAETYRNHFATDADSDHAAAFRASPHWQLNGTASESAGGMQFFSVTDAGRAALKAHLAAIGDEHRAFIIRYMGYETTVVAKTAGEARYSYFADLSDCDPDLSFKAFCKRASVHAAEDRRRRAA